MTEPTIEQLIDDVIEDAKIYGINMNAGGNLYSSLETSRAALLSEITEIQSSLEDEQKAHDDIATICFRAGAEADDGTSISAVKNLAKMVTQLQQEADEWRTMSVKLAEQLEYPDGLYGLTHCDSTTLQAYRDLSQSYNHAHPDEDTSVEGTEVK